MAFTPFEHWVDVDLTAKVPFVQLENGFFTQDNLGALLGVKVYINHEPHNLNGTLVYYVKFSDGTTLQDVSETPPSGNIAYVKLPSEAYAVVGPVTVILANRYGNEQKVLAVFSGYIYETTTDSQVTPGQSVPDIAAIQAIYQEMLSGVETMEGLIETGFVTLTDDSTGVIFTVR